DRIVPMLPGPPATLGAPIAVSLPRPRTIAELAHREEATRVRAHVIATLTAAMKVRKPDTTMMGTSDDPAAVGSRVSRTQGKHDVVSGFSRTHLAQAEES